LKKKESQKSGFRKGANHPRGKKRHPGRFKVSNDINVNLGKEEKTQTVRIRTPTKT